MTHRSRWTLTRFLVLSLGLALTMPAVRAEDPDEGDDGHVEAAPNKAPKNGLERLYEEYRKTPAIFNSRVFKRWWHWYSQRADVETGRIPEGAYDRARQQAEELAEEQMRDPEAERERVSTGTWVSIGPTPTTGGQIGNTFQTSRHVSGRIADVAVHPTDTARWLIGGAQGGIWETTDSGSTWTARTDGAASMAMGAIAYSTSSPTTVYAGTGEADFGYTGAGILKSTDTGATWSLLSSSPSFSGVAFSDIKVSFTDANTLVVGTYLGFGGRGSEQSTGSNLGFYKSTNGGTSFTQIRSGYVTDIEVYPSDFTKMYVAFGFPSGLSTNGLYRSTDSGSSLSAISGPWGAGTAVGRMEMAISTSDPNTLYVSIQDIGSNYGNLLGLWRTSNAWATTPTWTQISVTGTDDGTGTIGYCGYDKAFGSASSQCWYNHEIIVDPTNANILYAGGIPLWKGDFSTSTSSPTWTEVSKTSSSQSSGIHVDQHAMAWAGTTRLIAANDGGLWSTTDAGSTWTIHNSGLTLTQFYEGSVASSDSSFAIGGAQDNGSQKWNGSSWSLILAGGGDGADNIVGTTTSDFATSTQYLNIYRTRNGSSFTEVGSGITDRSSSAPFISRFDRCPSNADVVIAGTNNIWKTSNFFSSSTGQPTWTSQGSDVESISALAFAASDTSCNTYAFGGKSGALRITTNGGSSFTDLDAANGVPAKYITQVAFDPSNASTIYVTLSGFNGSGAGVYKTTNGGTSWTATGPAVSIPVNSIAIDPDSTSTIYVGTDQGIWKSSNSGSSWTQMTYSSTGIPNTAVYDLAISSSTSGSNRLVAFTHGRGAWRAQGQTVTVEFSSTSTTTANENAASQSITVKLTTSDSAVTGSQVTVAYATANGTASSGSDYTSTSGTLTFAAGTANNATTNISVPVLSDTLDESNETFTLTLSSPSNAVLGTNTTHTVTITDDDAAPTVSVSNPTAVTEGDTGSQNLGFVVTLSTASGQQSTVAYATSNGTATAGSDYTSTSGTLTFAAGTTTATVNVPVLGDTTDEANETFTFTLSSPSNLTLGTSSATGTINDNDAAPSVSVNSPSTSEGNSGTTTLNFTVTLSAASGQQATVSYATSDGTATAGSDYTAKSGTVTFSAGTTTQTVGVSVTGDVLVESNETFTFTLSSPTNASLGTSTGTGTITNDDSGPGISIADQTAAENAGSLIFTASLSSSYPAALTVSYSTTNGTATAGSDYTSTSGTLTFAASVTTATITVPVTNDTLDENNETFVVNLTSPSVGSLTDGSATGTINDDDNPPAISVNDPSLTEGDSASTNLSFTVSLSAASGLGVTVAYTTTAGTATAGTDYTTTSGTLTFTAGTTTGTVNVPVLGDTVDEANETFTLDLSSALNATISDNQGTGTINDNDGAPSVNAANATVTEGNSGSTNASVVVTLGAASAQQVTVQYATADGTAAAPGDYTAASGTLTFAAGVTTQTVNVPVLGDTTFETSETFTFALSNPVNATLGTSPATVTISNDDTGPNMAIGDRTVVEANTTASFAVTLSAAAGLQVTVQYATANGTATAGADYTSTTGTLTFPAGTTTLNIDVPVLADTLDEPDETYTVGLSNATSGITVTDNSGAGTITDDDTAPSVSVANAGSVTEGNSGTTNAAFAVSLSAASGQSVTVQYATSAGTATSGTDFTAASGTLTFTAGTTTQNVNVPVVGDTLDENDETFTLAISSPGNASLGTSSGSATITDDDTAPSVSASSPTVIEGSTGTSNAAFAVTLSAASGLQVTVQYATADGTATAGSDYTAATGTLTFAAGTTTQTVNVSVAGDSTYENNETFSFTLSNPVNASIGTSPGTGTISNDDAAPALVINDPSITEGDTGTANVTFTVTLLPASALTATVHYATSDGSAVQPGDYTSTVGDLTFAAGTTSQTFTVPVVGDTVSESSESFTVTLSSGVNATISDGNGTATIVDNDGSPALSIASNTATEGDSGTANLGFTVTLTPVAGQTVTVQYATSAGTATSGTDFTAASGTLTFSAGTTTQTINVPIVGDTLDEPNEAFTVTLSGATNATIATATATGTIMDNDPTPTASVGNATVTEGNTGSSSASFSVSLSAASGQAVTLDYATSDGTAAAGSDYTGKSGVLTFAAGTTAQSVIVSVTGDTTYEANETFTFTLSNPTNATLLTAAGTGTINNDDSVPGLSVSDASATEADSTTVNMTFTVSLAPASGLPATVQYATSNGSAGAPGDYTAASGTLTFAAGTTSQTFTVTVNGDTTNEGNETFTVTLSSPVNASLTDATGTGTIVDNDGPPLVSLASASVTEGNTGTTPLSFTVSLSAAAGSAVTVDYTTSNGTAGAPGDYTASSGTVTFAPSTTSATINVNVAGDTTDEADETFTVTLSNPVNATLNPSASTATGTITDDDAAPTVSLGNTSVTEGNGSSTATFTATLSAASGQAVTVGYTTANGTAIAGTDYVAASGTLTFAAGSTTQAFAVSVVGDLVDESDETFTATLSSPVNATLGTATGTATIVDDDTASLNIADASATEGNSGTTAMTFTVSLSTPSALQVTVAYATSDGTAAAGTDYTAASGTLTFAPGTTSRTFTVSVTGDTTSEANETFNVTLSGAANAAIADGSAVGTITEDDGASITPSATGVTAGSTVQAVINVGPVNFARDWVALYNSTIAADTAFIEWYYLNGSKTPPGGPMPTASVPFVLTTAGTYQFRLFSNDGYTRLAVSPTFTVFANPNSPSITAASTSASPGGTIQGTVANGPANTTDWVAFALRSGADTTFVDWAYLSGTKTPPTLGVANATVTLNLPLGTPNGTYELRFFASNGYARLATSAAVGVGVSVTPVISATPTSVDFSSVVVGTSAERTVTVKNTGGGTLTGSASVSGTGYSVVGTSTYSLGANQTATITVRSQPAGTGAQPGTLTLSGGGNASVPLTTTGITQPTITPSNSSPAPGATIQANVANGPGNATDWVALSLAGSANTAFVNWFYLNGSKTAPGSGSTTASVPFAMPTTPGSYEFRLFSNNGFDRLATSSSITVGGGASINTNGQATVTRGGTIQVTVANGPGTTTDWVGLVPAVGADASYVDYVYLNGTKTPPGSPLTNATFTYTVPTGIAPGSYNFRFFFNNGATKLATSGTVTVN